LTVSSVTDKERCEPEGMCMVYYLEVNLCRENIQDLSKTDVFVTAPVTFHQVPFARCSGIVRLNSNLSQL